MFVVLCLGSRVGPRRDKLSATRIVPVKKRFVTRLPATATAAIRPSPCPDNSERKQTTA